MLAKSPSAKRRSYIQAFHLAGLIVKTSHGNAASRLTVDPGDEQGSMRWDVRRRQGSEFRGKSLVFKIHAYRGRVLKQQFACCRSVLLAFYRQECDWI